MNTRTFLMSHTKWEPHCIKVFEYSTCCKNELDGLQKDIRYYNPLSGT